MLRKIFKPKKVIKKKNKEIVKVYKYALLCDMAERKGYNYISYIKGKDKWFVYARLFYGSYIKLRTVGKTAIEAEELMFSLLKSKPDKIKSKSSKNLCNSCKPNNKSTKEDGTGCFGCIKGSNHIKEKK